VSTIVFSELVQFRVECPRLRTVAAQYDLIGRHGAMAPVLRHRLDTLARSRPITALDIGAYDRAFGKSLEAMGGRCAYFSMDVDTSLPHDFRRLADVHATFDVIAMFELIEHLPYEETDELLHKAYALLAPGGCLFVSTPNPAHPDRYFSDVSHVQHWPAHDLYAELRHVGFSARAIDMYGVIYSSRQLLQRTIGLIRNVVWRLMGLDRRGGLLAIAVKEPTSGKDQTAAPLARSVYVNDR
jgi:SAM-dependent methyltransferase